MALLGPDPVLGHDLLLAGAGVTAQDAVVILSLLGSGSGHGLLGTETTERMRSRATVASQRGQGSLGSGNHKVNWSQSIDRGGFLQQHLFTLAHHPVAMFHTVGANQQTDIILF